MNELQRLRLLNLFAPPQEIGQRQLHPGADAFAPSPYNPSPLNAPDNSLGLLRRRATPYMDEYKDYLSKQPKREEHQLSNLGKILAMASGTIEGGITKSPSQGINTGIGLMERPYQTALEEYGTRGGRLKELAGLEHQMLTDEQKLAIQLDDQAIERQKAEAQAQRWMSQNNYDTARINQITEEAKTRGKSFRQNDVTGELEIVDLKDGSRMSIGQFAESVKQKDTRERGMFGYRHGIEQKGRERLQEDQQSHARAMQEDRQVHDLDINAIRLADDEYLAKLRQQLGRQDKDLERALEGMTPSAQKAAYELAYQQTKDDRPNLNPVEDYAEFMTELRTRLNNIRKRTTMDIEMTNDVPTIQLSADLQAAEELRKIGILNPTKEMIEEAKKDLGLAD